MRFLDHIQDSLARHVAAGLLRRPRTVTGPQGPVITVDGRTAICLCSNNYLGLADHPAIAAAAQVALGHLGYGAAASRHISGTMDLHRVAEARLARFVQQPRALLFSTGYAANTGAVQAITGPDAQIFSDELNHASLIDGCRLSRAQVHVYRHRDPGHLEQLLVRQRRAGVPALILTESVFSMDGDLAPLVVLRQLADRFGCGLVVDEAHALGVLGPSGRGLAARDGIIPDLLIGTLGKAFGTAGAFVAGPDDTVRLIENRARSYIFSTAPSPSLAAAALAAADLVEHADDRRATVLRHSERLRRELRALDYRVLDGETPVLPVIIGAPDATMILSARLLDLGVFAHGIRPPTVPAGTSRLRITPMATHSDEHVDAALAAFRAAREQAR